MPKSGGLEKARSRPEVLNLGRIWDSLGGLFKGPDPPRPTPPSQGAPVIF